VLQCDVCVFLNYSCRSVVMSLLVIVDLEGLLGKMDCVGGGSLGLLGDG
jgi:hypothetical protein